MSLPSAGNKARGRMYDAEGEYEDFEGDLGFEDIAPTGDEYLDEGEDYVDDYADEGEEYEEYEDEGAPLAAGDSAAASGNASLRDVAAPAVATGAAVGSDVAELLRENNMLLASMLHMQSGQNANAHTAQVRASAFNQKVQTKEINFVLNASLRDLAGSKDKAVLCISDAGKAAFPDTEVPLLGISIKSWRSSFPCSMVLSAEHLPNKAKNTVVSQSGFQGMFIVPGKSSSNGFVSEPILTDDESKWAREFRSAFPKVTIENVGKIGFGPGEIQTNTKILDNGEKEVQYLIPPENPVISKIIESREKQGVEHTSLFQPYLGKYVVSEREAKLAINEIKEQLATQVRSIKLADALKFNLTRAVVGDKKALSNAMFDKASWLDTAEIGGLIKSGNIEGEFDKVHHLYLTVNVKYQNP